MAELSPGLSDALGGSAPTAAGGSMMGAIEKALPKALDESLAMGRQQRQLGVEAARDIGRIRQDARELKAPPQPPPQEPPQPKFRSPYEAWGSLAMNVGLMASAFTRRPMINALNASAAVMQAYRQGDIDTAKREFDNWKAQTDYHNKLYEYQRDAYRDAIGNIDKDANLAVAQFKALSAALGDKPIHDLAEAGRLTEMGQLMRMRDVGYRQSLLEERKLREMGDDFMSMQQAQAALRAAKTPEEKAGAQQQLNTIQQRLQDRRMAYGNGPQVAQPGSVEGILEQWAKEFRDREKHDPSADEMGAQRSKIMTQSEQPSGTTHDFVLSDANGSKVRELTGQVMPSGGVKDIGTGEVVKPDTAKGETLRQAPPPSQGRQQATQLTRVRSAANTAVAALQNLVELPADANPGALMGVQFRTPDSMFAALQRSLARQMTPADTARLEISWTGLGRNLATLEAVGGATGLVGLSEQMDKLKPQSGDTPTIVMRRYAEARQIIERGIESAKASGNAPPEAMKLYDKIVAETHAAVPYSVHDVNELEKGLRAGGKAATESTREIAEKLFAAQQKRKPVPPAATEALRQHPEMQDEFDEHYGVGAAARVLGR